MRLLSRPRRNEHPAPRRPAAGRSSRTILVIPAVGAISITLWWMQTSGGLTAMTREVSSQQLAVLALAVGTTLAAPVLAASARARRRRERVNTALSWVEDLHVCAPPRQLRTVSGLRAVGAAGEGAETHRALPNLRALRLHVQSLETTLEEQNTHLAEARRALTGRPEQTAQNVEKVLITIRGLRGGLGAEDPAAERVLNRVEASVARLGSPTSFVRPTLPALALAVPADLPSASSSDDSESRVLVPVVPEPSASAPEPEARLTPEPTATAPSSAQEPPVVLPVPRPAPATSTKRTRRRLRRTAA